MQIVNIYNNSLELVYKIFSNLFKLKNSTFLTYKMDFPSPKMQGNYFRIFQSFLFLHLLTPSFWKNHIFEGVENFQNIRVKYFS